MTLSRSEEKRVLEVLWELAPAACCMEHLAARAGLPPDKLDGPTDVGAGTPGRSLLHRLGARRLRHRPALRDRSCNPGAGVSPPYDQTPLVPDQGLSKE